MSTSQSNCPNCRRAGSIELGRLAAMTTMFECAFSPSMRIEVYRTFSRLGAMESISSMKMIAGEFFSASSNAFRRLLSLSPAILLMISEPLMISGPLMRKKNVPVSLATALAMSILPVPGGRRTSSGYRGGA
ncbi:cell division control protein 48 [Mycena leptocephala]|nr:cell division control protein 48 [Mycena leptocephala]